MRESVRAVPVTTAESPEYAHQLLAVDETIVSTGVFDPERVHWPTTDVQPVVPLSKPPFRNMSALAVDAARHMRPMTAQRAHRSRQNPAYMASAACIPMISSGLSIYTVTDPIRQRLGRKSDESGMGRDESGTHCYILGDAPRPEAPLVDG